LKRCSLAAIASLSAALNVSSASSDTIVLFEATRALQKVLLWATRVVGGHKTSKPLSSQPLANAPAKDGADALRDPRSWRMLSLQPSR